MTYDKIQVTNGVAVPYRTHNGTDFYEFNQWAKTQSIDAPGVPDGVYQIGVDVEIKTFGCRNIDTDELPGCQCGYLTPEAKFCPHVMKELRLINKSPLIPTNQYSANELDGKEESNGVIELNINDFAISEEDLERAFAFGYLANPENNCLDNKEMMRRYEVFKNEYLMPMLTRKHIID